MSGDTFRSTEVDIDIPIHKNIPRWENKNVTFIHVNTARNLNLKMGQTSQQFGSQMGGGVGGGGGKGTK
jgi:hypothetical protein